MFSRRIVGLLLVLLLASSVAFGQGTLGRIVGTVTDATGAVVVGAKLDLADQGTGAKRSATSGADGKFVFLALQNGLYKLTVTMQGFQTAVYPDIKVDLGATAEIVAKLQVGAVNSEVVVEAAAEVLQTQTTAIEGGVQGRQLRTLPLNNRDVLDFVLLMPGAQQTGRTRNTTFEALPKSALNITMDGINIQDNAGKSSNNGGYFTAIRPKQDAIEEISVTTGNNTADNAGSGAVQIKFVTRRGTNDWHGGLFEFFRDQGLNANTYFNNLKGLRRQNNHLHQYGGSIGGPLIKNKVFIFNNFEDFRLPQGIVINSRILTNDAANGNDAMHGLYKYSSSRPAVNVLTLAAAAGLPSTLDQTTPFYQELLDIQKVRDPANLTTNVKIAALPTSGVWQSVSWNANAGSRRFFNTTRIDYDISDKVRWNVVGNWNHFQSSPDLLNNMAPGWPFRAGLVTPDPSKLGGAQNGERYSLVTALNWTITPRLNYEFRMGKTSSIAKFGDGMQRNNLYPLGYGFRFNSLGVYSLYGNPASSSYKGLPDNRDTPVVSFINNFGYITGKHTFTFGGQLELIKYWESYYNNAGVPRISIGCANGCGTSSYDTALVSAFNSANMPGSSSSTRSTARALYASLVGRVYGADFSRNLNPWTKQYTSEDVAYNDILKQKEIGVFFGDSFRAAKSLTLNFGLRFEYQGATNNPNGTYVGAGLNQGPTVAAAYGVSGPGNLFKPGILAGMSPTYYLQDSGFYAAPKLWMPSFGLAWSPTYDNKLWNVLFGGPGKTVFRGGYSIASAREGLYVQEGNISQPPWNGQTRDLTGGLDFLNPLGSTPQSQGPLMFSDFNTTNFSWNPAAGSVPYFTLPGSFTFPMDATQYTFHGGYVNMVNPNIKLSYIQSWSFGFQRELTPSMVVELRYQGNHAAKLWRDFDLNEVNIFENGFLQEFKNAQSNLAICSANAEACLAAQAAAGVPSGSQWEKSFANWSSFYTPPAGQPNPLAGQVNLPIMTAAFGTPMSTDASGTLSVDNYWNSWGDYIALGQAGEVASWISGTPSTLCNMVGTNLRGCANQGLATGPGPYPANFWTVNPDMDGGSYLLTNAGDSFYNSFMIELRRRMSKGLMIQGNYTFSKGISNLFADSTNVYSGFTTLRNTRYDRGISPYDLRHVARIFWTWELPFGPGRHFTVGNKVLSKIAEGWEFSGIAAFQSGRVFRLGACDDSDCYGTFNQNSSGILLNGITQKQLQSMVGVYKDRTKYPSGCSTTSYIYWLPPSFFNGSCGSPDTWGNGPLLNVQTPGVLGQRVFLHGPSFIKPDFTIAKQVKITERVNTRFEARFFNALNHTNFFVGSVDSSVIAPNIGATNPGSGGTGFGQTGAYYQDLNGNQDPGPRMMEFVLRINF